MLMDGEPPHDLAQGEPRVRKRILRGVWHVAAHGDSSDGSLSYWVGDIGGQAYVQIWQYDARVGNWGLRVLLLGGH